MDLTYTPAGIENVLGKNGICHSREQWMAARRAILRQGMHKDQSDSWNRLHTVTITVRTPALCLLDTSDKSFSLCLPYSSLTLCLIRTDNPTSLSIPSLVRYLCSTYDSFLITNTVLSLVH